MKRYIIVILQLSSFTKNVKGYSFSRFIVMNYFAPGFFGGGILLGGPGTEPSLISRGIFVGVFGGFGGVDGM
jgi:hypothetical protein